MKEIEIPEGYEAKIENNKIIFVPKVSEDERIRKAVIRLLQDGGYMEPQDKEKAFAWLEKQKKQKPAEINEYEIIKKHITGDALSGEVNKRLKECGWYVTDDKPAEWSEEDEKIRQDIENLIIFALKEGSAVSPAAETTKEQAIDWLKSLRPQPHWKPSEEQMMALQTAVADSLGKDYHNQLSLLEFDLRKRM